MFSAAADANENKEKVVKDPDQVKVKYGIIGVGAVRARNLLPAPAFAAARVESPAGA